ncbi:hypothetical protein A2627_04535 [Candidatus Woesebacteria bacterium RIFCSPHIGHO2_01_FULL_39_28]|uniref:Small ribosomal subunit protein bS20 n=1 Tax=Candidatus Woesebacteria bacterium RIFCSPHIGHO2_01_FULL_39_28 TaxID=1802496 RepID=A0A1F7YM44_9BACT|nr:MAG: hypothetical protein A2627_04535 [Candidatus Woesebacteria bacterium RIFCSPHIGHO2_01_FULL_39_28]OGM57057.1 MAG: hypothetical protein A3A50_05340 [Candidatus Woesebacteria bacterium RIFCSPLOWO2_01_FULL_38_20]
MPVTKTAKRALRSSKRKLEVNRLTIAKMEATIRLAKKHKTTVSIKKAISATDIATKKKVIHKNKAARLKSTLSKLIHSKPKTPKKRS